MQTRALIIRKTGELIRQKGVVGLSTAAIATECGIAHGSVFQHFGDRDTLVNTVLELEIKRIVTDMESGFVPDAGLNGLLDGYLDVLSREQDFLGVVYRELPFLPPGMQDHAMALEAVLRNTFYMAVEARLVGDAGGFHLALRLDAFFAAVNRYLMLRQYYAPGGISSRAEDIRVLFHILFEGVDMS